MPKSCAGDTCPRTHWGCDGCDRRFHYRGDVHTFAYGEDDCLSFCFACRKGDERAATKAEDALWESYERDVHGVAEGAWGRGWACIDEDTTASRRKIAEAVVASGKGRDWEDDSD